MSISFEEEEYTSKNSNKSENSNKTKANPSQNQEFLEKDLDEEEFLREIQQQSKQQDRNDFDENEIYQLNDIINMNIGDNDDEFNEITKEDEGKKKEKRRKRRKSELNTTPIPIFDCIYCVNEDIVYKYSIIKRITESYLYNCSIYDTERIGILLKNDIKHIGNDEYLNRLYEILIENTEFIGREYSIDQSKTYFSYVSTLKYRKYSPNLLYLLKQSKKNKTFLNLNTQLTIFTQYRQQMTQTNMTNTNIYLKKEVSKELSTIPVQKSTQRKRKSVLLKQDALSENENENDFPCHSSIEEEEAEEVGSFLNFLKFDVPKKEKVKEIKFDDEYTDIYSVETMNLVYIETSKYRGRYHVPNSCIIVRKENECLIESKLSSNK